MPETGKVQTMNKIGQKKLNFDLVFRCGKFWGNLRRLQAT